MASTKKSTVAQTAAEESKKQVGREAEIKVRINKLFDDPDKKLKAIAGANIGGGFAVHGLKVYEGDKGLFVAMPQSSYKSADGTTKYEDIFHPVTAEARTALNGAVIDAYNDAIGQAQDETQDAGPGMNM